MLPVLCSQCAHKRSPTGLNFPTIQLTSAEQQKALAGRRAELRARQILEQNIVNHESTGTLKFRPIDHDWCAAQSAPVDGSYWFCEWLKAPTCPWFRQAGDGASPDVVNLVIDGLRPHPVVQQFPVAEESSSPSVVLAEAAVADWKLTLGAREDINPGLRVVGNDLELDYKLSPSGGDQLALSDKGVKQTILIFGGPGAGKTFLFKHLMEGLLSHPDYPGALVLDPKGVLGSWITEACLSADRLDDLLIVSSEKNEPFNALGNFLSPESLGRLLADVVLAESPDVDQGWAVLIMDLLQSACRVLAHEENQVTARLLLEEILFQKSYTWGDGKKLRLYPIQARAITALRRARKGQRLDPTAERAYMRIEDYFASTEDKQRRFVRQVIEASLGDLASDEWVHLSNSNGTLDPYEDILRNHRVVLVSTGQGSPAFQRSLSTLMKALYQQRALKSLIERDHSNGDRLSILACDEYAQVVTEGSSGLVSDARFFSLAREAGCLSLFALQSIATARSRFPHHMRDRWDGILGNVGIRFFMGLNDLETAQMASSLAGERDRAVRISSTSHSAAGTTVSDNNNLTKVKVVPEWYLTNRMPTGTSMVQGKLDGRSAPTLAFFKVPGKSQDEDTGKNER